MRIDCVMADTQSVLWYLARNKPGAKTLNIDKNGKLTACNILMLQVAIVTIITSMLDVNSSNSVDSKAALLNLGR